MLGEVSLPRCKPNASGVLNDAVETCSSHPPGASAKREIRFTDPELESSEVLPLVLDLILKGKHAAWAGNYAACRALCRAVAFMQKYECAASLAILRIHATNVLLLGQMAPLYVFLLAAALDDAALSVLAFRHRSTYRGSAGALPDVARHGLPGVEDPGTLQSLLSLAPVPESRHSMWPFALWAHTPLEYVWAATKAWSAAWADAKAVNENNKVKCVHKIS